MSMNYRIGIDIGGTKVNVGLLREDGGIVEHCVFSSAGAAETDSFVDVVCTAVEGLLSRNSIELSQVSHIGVGIPGTANPQKGLVEYSCNLFGEDVPLGDSFSRRLHRDVLIVQDSWAAAWAEYLFGIGRGHGNLLCVTIGTGIGCGVLLNGKVFAGAMHTAGELGHIPIVWEGRPCSCGRRGCLEAYASGSAIWAQALERFPQKLAGRPRCTESVFELIYEGDREARALVDECTDKLAYGLAIALSILSVDTVIISGGLSIHKQLMIDPLREKTLGYGYPSWTRKNSINVLQAQLGSNAPMVGAAFLTLEDMQTFAAPQETAAQQ
ncbi:MAG: ROK family protein [Eubacteriales bacterium]|nr:ROK family protein [Eubacteriales bacterium]